MESIYLFGTSTTASRVKSFIEFHQLYKIEGFLVDDNYKTSDSFEGHKILTISEFRDLPDYTKVPVFICIAWNRLNQDRKDLFNRYEKEFNLVNLVSPHSVIRGELIGTNILVGDYSVLEMGSTVQRNCILDHQCFIGSRSVIEQHSYIAVKVMIAGSTTIGEQSFVGINATIFDQVRIGKKCIIAGGETIKRNVENFSAVKSSGIEQMIQTYSEKEVITKLLASKNVR